MLKIALRLCWSGFLNSVQNINSKLSYYVSRYLHFSYALGSMLRLKLYPFRCSRCKLTVVFHRDLIPSQWTESESTLYVWPTRENLMEFFRTLSTTLLALDCLCQYIISMILYLYYFCLLRELLNKFIKKLNYMYWPLPISHTSAATFYSGKSGA